MDARMDLPAESRIDMRLWTAIHERLMGAGPRALSEIELLALLLTTKPEDSSHSKAARLLARHGTLRSLLTARPGAKQSELDAFSYTQLQAAIELARRHLREQLHAGPLLSSDATLHDYLQLQLGSLPYEVFGVVLLDKQHRLLRFVQIFRGTLDGVTVHPREVVRDALADNASAAILVHNHPSGITEPSPPDEMITTRLLVAFESVDIEVLDHLIVAHGEIVSFTERGLL
jgi:DNA repair protein RadC